VVGHFEQVDPREAAGHEDRIDPLLDVAREEEPLGAERAEQDDRDVVDAGPGVRRLGRHRRAVGPEHLEADVVEGEPIAGRESPARLVPGGERRLERCVSGTGTGHSGLDDACHSIAIDDEREAAHVILVRVGHDDEIDPAIPRRNPFVEGDEQPVRVRAAVHEQAPTRGRLHEDRITLAHVERDDVETAVRPRDRRHRGERDEEGEERREQANAAVRAEGARAVGARSRGGSRLVAGGAGRVLVPGSLRPAARPEHPRDATSRRDDDEQGRGQPPERSARRRGEGHPGEREIRRRLHDQDHEPDREGARQAEQRGEERRGAGADREAAGHGEGPGRHGRWHQWHDDEVEERRERGQPAEREKDDRKGRRLRRERDGEPFDDEAGQPRHPRSEAGGERRAPCEQAGSRRGGQLEPGVGHRARVEAEQDHHGPRERPRGGSGPTGLARQQRDARHHRRAEDRRGRAGEDGVEGDRGDGRHRAASSWPAPKEGRHEARDDRDVPSGDRHDVREAGGREVRRQVAIDPLPQPDQDSGGQPPGGLGKGARECVPGVGADALDEPVRVRRRVEGSNGTRQEGGRDADPGEVRAVRTLGRRPQGSEHLDAIADDQDRVARGRDVDPKLGAVEATHEALGPVLG
jgi:hypothetical protein